MLLICWASFVIFYKAIVMTDTVHSLTSFYIIHYSYHKISRVYESKVKSSPSSKGSILFDSLYKVSLHKVSPVSESQKPPTNQANLFNLGLPQHCLHDAYDPFGEHLDSDIMYGVMKPTTEAHKSTTGTVNLSQV